MEPLRGRRGAAGHAPVARESGAPPERQTADRPDVFERQHAAPNEQPSIKNIQINLSSALSKKKNDILEQFLSEVAHHFTPDFLAQQTPSELKSLHKSLQDAHDALSKDSWFPHIASLFSSKVQQVANLVNILQDARDTQEKKVDDFISRLEELGAVFTSRSEIKRLILDNRLYLNGESLTSLPAEIVNLHWLRELMFSHNAITSVPASILNLEQLRNLRLNGTQITALPPEIGNLHLLRELDLSNTPISGLPAEIGNLHSLRKLDLDDTQISSLPSEIGDLHSLQDLRLAYTAITSVPASILNLEQLWRLDLSKTGITALPSEIGNLHLLRELGLGGTAITSMPASIRNLEQLQLLDLRGAPISAQAENEHTLGRRELRAHFGDRVLFDDPKKVPPMPADTKLDDVYNALDAQPERINRDAFKTAKLPEIPGQTLNGEEFMKAFGDLQSKLNLDDEKKTGYLSYELLAGDYASDARNDTTSSNAEKIQKYLMPRLTGYFKTLYNLPLTPGERRGWQMYDEQKPAMKYRQHTQ